MSTDSIESILHENRTFEPGSDFARRARIHSREQLKAIQQEAEQDNTGFWAKQAREELNWHTPFTKTLDDSRAPHYQWFADGKLNVSHNCLDRHLATRGDKTAIIFEGEQGDTRTLSYRELHADV